MSTGSIIFIVVVLFVLFIALILLFSGLYVVKQQTVAIIERFGKYQKTSTSGINFKIPFGIDVIAARIQLRMLQSEIIVETKTQDNVFVTMNVATQYRVNENNVTDAYYKLMHPEAQIKSYIERCIGASQISKIWMNCLKRKMKLP